jgi:hypothetical protein
MVEIDQGNDLGIVKYCVGKGNHPTGMEHWGSTTQNYFSRFKGFLVLAK